MLRLLRSDLSGPDIARELLVSLNTLRTHTKHIYTKLGVTNRREAVSRAADSASDQARSPAVAESPRTITTCVMCAHQVRSYVHP